MPMMQRPNMRMRGEEMPMRKAPVLSGAMSGLPAAMAGGQGQGLAEAIGKLGAAAGGQGQALDAIAGMRAANQGRGIAGALGPASGNMKKGGKVATASKRADGIAKRGKTKGRMC